MWSVQPKRSPAATGSAASGVVAVRMLWVTYARMIAAGSQWVMPRCRMNGSRWSTSGDRGPPLVMVATRDEREGGVVTGVRGGGGGESGGEGGRLVRGTGHNAE
jgi:uncharacterized membrane protein YgcG